MCSVTEHIDFLYPDGLLPGEEWACRAVAEGMGSGRPVTGRFTSPDDVSLFVKKHRSKKVLMTLATVDAKSNDAKSQSCRRYPALWADVDIHDVKIIRRRLKKLDIDARIVCSGGRYHVYVPLTEPTTNSRLAIRLMSYLCEALEGDSGGLSAAAAPRVPGSFNNKTGRPKEVSVVAPGGTRYTLEELKKCIPMPAGASRPGHVPIVPNELYKAFATKLPCVTMVLGGVTKGERNFFMGRLVSHLKVSGHAKDYAKRIMESWNELCDPPMERQQFEDSFKGYWATPYKLLGCKIPDRPDLQQILNTRCNKMECPVATMFGGLDMTDSAEMSNRVLNRKKTGEVPAADGKEIAIYGIVLRHPEGLTREQLLDELKYVNTETGERKLTWSERTIDKYLKHLVQIEAVRLFPASKRRKLQEMYVPNEVPHYNNEGYTRATYAAIRMFIARQLTSAKAFQLYVKLMAYIGKKSYDRIPAQWSLSVELYGCKDRQGDISRLLQTLIEAKFLDIATYGKDRFGNDVAMYRALI